MAIPCDEWCDPTTPRTFEQTGARFNERSSFANAAAMDNFNHMQQHVLVEALNTLQMHGMVNALMQFGKVASQPTAP